MQSIKLIIAAVLVMAGMSVMGQTTDFFHDGTSLYYTGGNVGIGINAPQKQLDLTGHLSLGMAGKIFSKRQDNSYHEFFSMDNNNDIIINRSSVVHGLPSHLLMFIGEEKTFQVKNSSNQTLFRINEVNGRIGIGTAASPQATLEVAGDILIGNSGKLLVRRSDEIQHEMFSMDSNDDILINRGSIVSDLPSSILMGIGENKVLDVRNSSNNTIMRIEESTGNMYVDGKITANEIEVKLDVWPDYVFSDTYNLKPLSEVEKYISINKKLPGMPSEDEITENGLSVGEINKKMMEKIEELTLYVIQLEKEINTLKNE